MSVCPDCGNKRCPKATHHDWRCTGSNKVAQIPEPAETLEETIREIVMPKGILGEELIVGITNFRGDVIIATEFHVYRMSHDKFTEIKF
jgi:uncharacterized OB-fold protein